MNAVYPLVCFEEIQPAAFPFPGGQSKNIRPLQLQQRQCARLPVHNRCIHIRQMTAVLTPKHKSAIWNDKARGSKAALNICTKIILPAADSRIPLAPMPQPQSAHQAADRIQKRAKDWQQHPGAARVNIEWSWDFVVLAPRFD